MYLVLGDVLNAEKDYWCSEDIGGIHRKSGNYPINRPFGKVLEFKAQVSIIKWRFCSDIVARKEHVLWPLYRISVTAFLTSVLLCIRWHGQRKSHMLNRSGGRFYMSLS